LSKNIFGIKAGSVSNLLYYFNGKADGSMSFLQLVKEVQINMPKQVSAREVGWKSVKFPA